MISAWTSFYYQIFHGAKPLIYQVSSRNYTLPTLCHRNLKFYQS